ncbi:MAG TPA: substrate-binding domain-containing protein [Solirubrobacteraceae bacterium]|jgi:ABC-type phosphate transport system substrate-binding protein|nr:substrate-binding domain-containing protein [Solirubrobacteraceae bacterium]
MGVKSRFWLTVVVGLVLAALATPGGAEASLGERCSGSSIAAQGSWLQVADQESLGHSFNDTEDHSPRACSGTQGAMLEPKVSYTPTGNLSGLQSWGAGGHAADFSASNALIATDVPPNATQREEIVAHSSEPEWASLETIPVQQYTVAVIVNLPAHCKANNDTSHRGFLALTSRTLEKIWQGQIHNWNEIADSGDVVENLAEKNCDPSTPITRVVSRDDSGSSWTLEKYLYLIDKEKNVIGSQGWRELAEGPAGAQWPGTVTRPSEEGEEAVASLVAATPGSIAVVSMTPQVEELFTGGVTRDAGEGRERSIALLQNNGLVGSGSATYVKLSPHSSNACSGVVYTNDGVLGLPAGSSSLWNGVTTKITESGYSLCGLSYVLALRKYSQYPGTSEAEATTVSDYLRFTFSISHGGGLEQFHPDLSAQLLEESRRGAEAIGY